MLLECLTVTASAVDRTGATASLSLPTTDDLHGLFYGSGSYKTLPFENPYATVPVPVPVVQPAAAYIRPDEEELHTSFEQAISDRVTAINSKLRRITDRSATPTSTAPLQPPVGAMTPLLHSFQHCQRRVRLASLALLLLLAGFDLMGMLVLSMH